MTPVKFEISQIGILSPEFQNYKGNNLLKPFNPFVPEEAVPAGVALMDSLIKEFGTTSEGINKSLAAYNQGPEPVRAAVRDYGSDWINHIPKQGRDYVNSINAIRSGQSTVVPGYFGFGTE